MTEMKGPVIWVTGLSGAGKTTLCGALHEQLREPLRKQGRAMVLLDGDVVREAFGSDLGYTASDRVIQVQRMQRLTRMLTQQGIVVVVAALYSTPELLAWNRAELPGYFEVYLRASIDSLAGRDPKGLYAQYAGGAMTNVVGLDITYTPPAHPDIVFDADAFGDVRAMAAMVVDAVLPGAARGRA
jgi:adenylylsulfate kinase-like enzyme